MGNINARARDRKLNPRTCIVSREAKTPDELLRFVCDPDGRLVVDLKANLPGRGAWVTAKQEMVRLAMERNLFSKSLEQKVTFSETLDQDIAELMQRSVMGSLAMANKAGMVVFGYSKVNDLIRSGSAGLVLHAKDAAADGIRKIGSALRAVERTMDNGDDEADVEEANQGEASIEEVPFVASFSTSDELDQMLGGINIMHVAAKPGGATDGLKKKLVQLQNYCDE